MEEMYLPYEEYHTPEHCQGCKIQFEMGMWVPVRPHKDPPQGKE